MLRTRDFVLFLLVVVFLALSITGSILKKTADLRDDNSTEFVEKSEVDYSAEIYKPEAISRADRLAEMKKKIAEGGSLSLSESSTYPDKSEEEITDEETGSTSEVIAEEVRKCPNYVTYTSEWPRGVKMEVVEGSRMFYTEMSLNSDNNTSTSVPQMINSKNSLVKLSLYPTKANQSTCLSSDVIGVALDGSLIRNAETGVYSVFGGDTLVGYALDGFPIFGLNNISTDTCGGALVNGQYGYVIKSDRDAIMNCFVGRPASL